MFKILKECGTMNGHLGVEIFELEEIGRVAVNFERSDGTNIEAWRCDEFGNAIRPNEPSMTFESVNEPVTFDDDGEPLQWELVGFELK